MRETKEPCKCVKEKLDITFTSIDDAISSNEEVSAVRTLLSKALSTTTEIDEKHNIRMTEYYQKLDRLITMYENKYGVDF